MRPLAVLVASVWLAWPAPGAAAEPAWVPLADSGPDATVEIDPASLDLREGLLTVWLRLDLAEPARGRILPFRSAVMQHAVDCARRRHAAIRVTTYSDRRGEGDVIDRWDRSPEDWLWRPARGGATDADLVRLACRQAPAIAFSMPMTTSPP